MTILVALPVLVPVLAAGLTLVTSRRLPVRGVSVVVLTAVLADSAALLILADDRGPLVLDVSGWPPPLGITLVADRLSALLLTTAVAVALAVLLFAIGQGAAEEHTGTVAVFHPSYLLLVAGVGLAFLTGDLFNLFVAFEMMLAASYVLITLDAGASRTRAGMTYTATSLISSMLFLTTVALIYAATGTVSLAQLGDRLAGLPDGLRGALSLLLLVVFGIKAAIVPLHFWLPDSYPTAPAPITAVFAALLTKVGMYALLRTQTLLFPRDGPWEPTAVLAVAAMLVGVLGALAQDDVNRLLSFTLVSHMGYMLFGLALFDVTGLTGTVLYMVHHIVVQATLFLVAGLILRRTGTSALHRMAGRPAPGAALALLFALPALSLAGVPPLSGFVAKVTLLQAGLAHDSPAGPVLAGAAVVTSLLSLYAMARVWRRAFLETRGPGEEPGEERFEQRFGEPYGEPGGARDVEPGGAPGGEPEGEERHPSRAAAERAEDAEARAEADWGTGGRTTAERLRAGPRGAPLMFSAAAGMAVIGLAVALFAGPLARVAERAATDLIRPDTYRSAVLGDEAAAGDREDR